MMRKQYMWMVPVLIGLLWVITAIPAAAQYPDSTAVPFGIEVPRFRSVQPGSMATVRVKKIYGSEPMYGFDFLLAYDTSFMKFAGAYRPQIYSQPGAYEWEYLAVDPYVPAECPPTGDCPAGRVRITGIADIDNGDHHPLQCDIPDDTTLCILTFNVPLDSSLECRAAAISFFWQTCSDNTILLDTASGLQVVSRAVYDFENWNMTDPEFGLPGLYGVPDSCLLSASLPEEARFADFHTGVIDIICYDSIDWRGDINANCLAYEIADWVMFTNYFMAGFRSFGVHLWASIAASDVNGDGDRLQLADLIYLQRVICGDTMPLPLKSGYRSTPDSITFVQDVRTHAVSVEYPDTLAAVYLLFEGNIEPSLLLDTSVYSCAYQYDGEITAVLISHPLIHSSGDCIIGFPAGPLFTYTGNGLLVHDGSDQRKTSAATLNDNVFPNPTLEITGSYDGAVVVEPDTISWGIRRIMNVLPDIVLYAGDFAEHTAEDIDPASVRVNDSIVPTSVEVIPSHPDFGSSVLKITVPAIQFINSFGEKPFPTSPLNSFLYYLTDFGYVAQVSGDFIDGLSFASLGGITMNDGPVTIRVPTGWPTIAQAVDTARGGDTIILEDGVYTGDGNRDISVGKSLVILSEHGPANTVIDCQGAAMEPHFAFDFPGTYDSLDVIQGLTITGAYGQDQPPIWKNRGNILLRNCVVHHNRSFAADEPGPLVGIDSYGGGLTVESCTFSGNTGSFILYNRGTTVVHNTIIAFNDATPINSYLEIACTDIFGNTQGDWRGDLAAYLDMDGNISQDPLFCDTAAYDYSLNGFSPCLAAGNSCQETIGAYDLGCGVVCGEIDGDIGINIADVVYLVNYIFRDGPPPVNMPAADTNASGEVDVGDAVALLNYIFRSEDIITCTFND